MSKKRKNKKGKKQIKRIFVSMPMRYKTHDEIMNKYFDILEKAEDKFPDEDFHIIDTYDEFYSNDISGSKIILYVHLAVSIENMESVDYIYFDPTWEQEEACRIEHKYALQHGFNILDIGEN